MFINMTEAQLVKHFQGLCASEIVGYLMEEGLETIAALPSPLGGIYRRLGGLDLISVASDGATPGAIHQIQVYSQKYVGGITWDVYNTQGDEWVLVLDTNHNPVFGTAYRTIQFDPNGNRIK